MIGTFSIVKQEVPMTQERMSPLRQRMIPSRDIAAQYPAGQGKRMKLVSQYVSSDVMLN